MGTRTPQPTWTDTALERQFPDLEDMMVTEAKTLKHWSIKTALEQIEKCDFECEGGPLVLNQAYIWLKAAAKVGPEFWPGQGVFYQVTAEVGGIKLTKWSHYFVVGCCMDSGTDNRFWTYMLSNDPPGPYHYGTVHYTGVRAKDLRLEPSDGET